MTYWQKRQLDELTKTFDTVAGGMDQILVQEYQRLVRLNVSGNPISKSRWDNPGE